MVMGLMPVVGVPLPMVSLWRLGDAGPDGGLRAGAERACPSPPDPRVNMRARVLFSAPPEWWPL